MDPGMDEDILDKLYDTTSSSGNKGDCMHDFSQGELLISSRSRSDRRKIAGKFSNRLGTGMVRENVNLRTEKFRNFLLSLNTFTLRFYSEAKHTDGNFVSEIVFMV